MAQTLSTLSLISYIAAAVFFVIALMLFFALRIPKTFSDYTGRSARKKIMKIRDANDTQKKSRSADQPKKAKGKKAVIPPPPPVRRNNDDMPDTGVIAENKAHRYESEETAMLEDATAELGAQPEPVQPVRPANVKLKLLNEVMLIHTQEVIP